MTMKNRNITSADATAIMTVEELFPNGFRLQQFSTDTLASVGDSTYAETRMGVDGMMVAGYTPNIKTVTISLEASSPSISYMETLIKATETNKKCYQVMLMISIPATGETYKYSNGVLKTGKLMPDVKKTLDPISFTFDFEKVE